MNKKLTTLFMSFTVWMNTFGALMAMPINRGNMQVQAAALKDQVTTAREISQQSLINEVNDIGYMTKDVTTPSNLSIITNQLPQSKTSVYVFEDDFSSYPLGKLNDSKWEVSHDIGNITIVDNGDGTQSAKIFRPGGGKTGSTYLRKTDLGLDGIVAMEIKLKKSGGNHFSMPYLYSSRKHHNALFT